METNKRINGIIKKAMMKANNYTAEDLDQLEKEINNELDRYAEGIANVVFSDMMKHGNEPVGTKAITFSFACLKSALTMVSISIPNSTETDSKKMLIEMINVL